MYKKTIHKNILTALLAVIALSLALIQIPVPFIPPFLTLDLAFIPLFFALLISGYKSAITAAIIKNILYFLLISREPVGSIANMLVEIIFLSILVYYYRKNNKNIIFGGILATLAITIFMSLANYFVLLPLYGYIIDLKDIINNIKTIVTYGIIPFNIIKGIFLIVLLFITKTLIKKLPTSLLTKFQ